MMIWTLVGMVICSAVRVASDNIPHIIPGPWVNATQGEVWPLPFRTIKSEGFLILKPSTFNFSVTGETCDIIQKAILRYTRILQKESRSAAKFSSSHPAEYTRHHPLYKGNIVTLDINLSSPCETKPYLDMKEYYSLNIYTSNSADLTADSVWGILRGLETFSQLLTPSGHGRNMIIQCQNIFDKPLLSHRGLLLDTSRHFLHLPDILLTLDAMSYNKLNVLHWHIVDDNSFPFQSTSFPDLSRMGAYHSSLVYTPKDVQTVIETARLLGIRVIPEFDTPGHTRSWGLSRPDLLTPCYDQDGKLDGQLGPLNPANQDIYIFLRALFAEIRRTFSEEYVHLGGDEVPFDCWASNPDVVDYMREKGMGNNYAELEQEYIQKLLNITSALHMSSIVWQEVFDNGVQMTQDTLVHVWTGDRRSKMGAITRAGYRVLLSECWYLDHLGGDGDWQKFYDCDPLDFYGSNSLKALMVGGEACMWGEFVNSYNVHPRIWPRASATAERLWSSQTQDIMYVAKRLEEHACRMNKRGISAQPPNGAGFCVV